MTNEELLSMTNKELLESVLIDFQERDEKLAKILRYVDSKTSKIKDVSQFAHWLYFHSYFESPASTKYHGAYKGGLFDHSFEVARKLVELTDLGVCRTWENPTSPLIIGLFHDLCKCEEYQNNGDPAEWVRVDEDSTLLRGHGEKSVMMLSRFMTLTEEEILCIRYHMGAFNKEDVGLYSKAVHKYPNVLWTHTADMYASQVLGV